MTVPGNGFGDRLARSIARHGRLCVGIDPHSWLLRSWGFDDDAAAAERFGRVVVEACAGQVGIIKAQVACFERFGSAGFQALERVLAAGRRAGLIVIADAKRGDIGSTMASYAAAWLTPGAPLESDAVTLTAYLGTGSLEPVMADAVAAGKGVFVLAATSNPEARVLQNARTEAGESVAASIVEDMRSFNRRHPGGELESAGVVLGATVALGQVGIQTDFDTDGGVMPVLAPGFGSQGALLSDLHRIYGAFTPGVIVHESRSLLKAGPKALRGEIARHLDEVRSADV